jgi:hypothetical protein
MFLSKQIVDANNVREKKHIFKKHANFDCIPSPKIYLSVIEFIYRNSGQYSLPYLLFITQLNSIGLSVPHTKHITCPLRAIYRFVTIY